MRPSPTNQQLRVLGMIATAIRVQGYPPSKREICRVFGWASQNSVNCHLYPLRRRGLLAELGDDKRKSRVLRVTEAGYAAIGMSPPVAPLEIARLAPAPRVVEVNFGARCGRCNAHSFATEKPCFVCKLTDREARVA